MTSEKSMLDIRKILNPRLFALSALLACACNSHDAELAPTVISPASIEFIADAELVQDVLDSVCPASSLIGLNHAQYEAFVEALSDAPARHQVERELIAAVMAVESACIPDARSPVGAFGPMQLMPKTASWLGAKNPSSIRENIDAGARYLGMMINEFDGDLSLALAAYNAGPTTVRRHNSIPPYRETRNFVAKVLDKYSKLRSGLELRPV